MPQRLGTEDRRRAILDAAEELMVERGYAGARLTDIAGRTGVSRQLVQRHFATKLEVYMALMERHRRGLLAIVATAAGPTGGDATSTTGVLDAWLGYVERHPFARTLLFEDSTGLVELRAHHARMRTDARALIVAALEAHAPPGIRLDQLEPLAEMIRSSTVGLARWWEEHPSTPRHDLVELVAEIWRRALGFAPEAAAPPRRASGPPR